MNIKQVKIGLWIFVFVTLAAHAGTWGPGSFDNDDALDWLQNDFESDGAAAIEGAVNAVARSRSSDYIDAPLASRAVAACEFLAAWQGRPSKDIPDPILAEAKILRGAPREALRERARKALDRVVKDSELQALWAEGNEPEYEQWKKAMADLRARL
ncbi:MAG: DUF4259 domain-containing protein [Opitutaceae bacterium]